jgi:ferredoxin
MAKVPIVDQGLCIGRGEKTKVCPSVFELADEKTQVNGPDKCGICSCHSAIAACPVQAISWSE